MGRRRAGFTLLELNLVVTIVGLLTVLAAPAYVVYLRRAQAAEALTNLETMSYLQQVHILEAGRAVACEPVPAAVPRGTRVVFEPTPSWSDLGVHMESRVRFQYSVETPSARAYVIRARGDLDGDGVESLYTLDSQTMQLSIGSAGE